MADLSNLSDDDLMAMYQAEKAKVTKDPYVLAQSKTMGQEDAKRMSGLGSMVRDADSMLATAGEGRRLLDDGAPTGFAGDFRTAVGKVAGGFAGGLLGVPDKQETDNLQRFRQVANQATLGDTSKLRGPLSDKDIAFLKEAQININASPEANRRALAAQEWAATRMKAYESALQSWTQHLGRPSALNPRGQSFDAWFSTYANGKIPPPYTKAASAAGPRPSTTANAPRRAAAGGGARIIEELP